MEYTFFFFGNDSGMSALRILQSLSADEDPHDQRHSHARRTQAVRSGDGAVRNRVDARGGARFRRQPKSIRRWPMPGWDGSPRATRRCRRVQQLYTYGARLHRETNRLGVSFRADQSRSLPVDFGDRGLAAGLALASALIDDRQYEKAQALLGDSSLLDTWENHQWQQYIEAYLMFATQRWPDVISAAAAILPPQAMIMSAVTAATCTLLRPMPQPISVRRGSRWSGRTGRAAADTRALPSRAATAHETAVTAIDPNDFPLIAADLAYVRGMAHRQLGEEDKAQIWLSRATINGALIESAKQALAIRAAAGGHRQPPSRLAPTNGM